MKRRFLIFLSSANTSSKIEQFIETLYPTQDPKQLASQNSQVANAQSGMNAGETALMFGIVTFALVCVSGVMVLNKSPPLIPLAALSIRQTNATFATDRHSLAHGCTIPQRLQRSDPSSEQDARSKLKSKHYRQGRTVKTEDLSINSFQQLWRDSLLSPTFLILIPLLLTSRPMVHFLGLCQRCLISRLPDMHICTYIPNTNFMTLTRISAGRAFSGTVSPTVGSGFDSSCCIVCVLLSLFCPHFSFELFFHVSSRTDVKLQSGPLHDHGCAEEVRKIIPMLHASPMEWPNQVLSYHVKGGESWLASNISRLAIGIGFVSEGPCVALP